MKDAVALFKIAEKFLRENGFGQEIDRFDNPRTLDEMNDRELLQTYAWVVFSSGMRNAVIEAKWREITKAFRDFNPPKIAEDLDAVRRNALNVFRHYKKVDAVIQMTQLLLKEGLALRSEIKEDPLNALYRLPFIGKVNRYHLARNLGFNVIKPDRHLVRLASKYEMTPFELCELIHQKTGRRLATIDAILWRYCEQKGQT